jgi:putative iron-dependent peroxidase
VTLGLAADADVNSLLGRLAVWHDERAVVGLGESVARAVGRRIEGLHSFEGIAGPGVAVPSTQGALWVFVAGEDAGDVLLRTRNLVSALGSNVVVDEDVPAFSFAGGRDLSGYEDGTENPKGERALEVALVQGQGSGLDGGSFVSVQRWEHDLTRFERLAAGERDAIIGRSRETNDELDDAPAWAHVKRSAQESFEPEAFLLRRSMPYGDVGRNGLYFVAYGAALSAFERILRRMVGLDDGIVDGLFRFTRPRTGGHYFCPPLREGRLDLSAFGL